MGHLSQWLAIEVVGCPPCCVCAGSGTEALEVYLTCDPPVKLVLLDVTLPDMSGHEVCASLGVVFARSVFLPAVCPNPMSPD